MPKYAKGSEEAKKHMAELRALAKAKREALKNVSLSNIRPSNEESNSEPDEVQDALKEPTGTFDDSSSDTNVEVEVIKAPVSEASKASEASEASKAKKPAAKKARSRKAKIIEEPAQTAKRSQQSQRSQRSQRSQQSETQVEVENDPEATKAIEPRKFVRRNPKKSNSQQPAKPAKLNEQQIMPPVSFDTNPLLAPRIIRFH